MAGGGKIVNREPVESSGGGRIESVISAGSGRASVAVRAYVGAYMEGVRADVSRDWPIGRERNRPHSADLFSVTDQSRGWFIKFTLINPADYSAFVYRPGLGMGPWPGPGPWRRWEDLVRARLDRDLPAIRAEVGRLIAKSFGR